MYLFFSHSFPFAKAFGQILPNLGGDSGVVWTILFNLQVYTRKIYIKLITFGIKIAKEIGQTIFSQTESLLRRLDANQVPNHRWVSKSLRHAPLQLASVCEFISHISSA